VAAVSVLVLGLRLASVIAESASRFGGDRCLNPKTKQTNKQTNPPPTCASRTASCLLRLACRTLHAASWGAGKDEAAKRNRQAARKAAVLAITFALIWLAMTGARNEWLIAVPSWLRIARCAADACVVPGRARHAVVSHDSAVHSRRTGHGGV
jgi:hypothetical protein